MLTGILIIDGQTRHVARTLRHLSLLLGLSPSHVSRSNDMHREKKKEEKKMQYFFSADRI